MATKRARGCHAEQLTPVGAVVAGGLLRQLQAGELVEQVGGQHAALQGENSVLVGRVVAHG